MTDATTRAKERTGGGIMERLRADELPAYTMARDVACSEGTDCAEWGACPGGCKGTGRVPYEPQDVLRALAFLGVEEAREAVGVAWEAVFSLVSVEERLWSGSLRDLLSKLPPHRLEVGRPECGRCEGSGRYVWPEGEGPPASYDTRCVRCQGTGKSHHDTPAERWLMADAALAVARKCWECHALPYCSDLRTRIEDALLDAQAWVEEPTRERERAWQGRSDDWNGTPAWVPSPHSWAGIGPTAAETLQAAAVIGEPRVREVVTAALLGRLL